MKNEEWAALSRCTVILHSSFFIHHSSFFIQIPTEMNKSHKSIVTQIPLLREGGVPKGRGGRYTNSIVNESFMHSPTTSPYGYSSFPKEEI